MFYSVYSRNNLSKIKDRAYVINHDEYKSVRSHLIALYPNGDNVTHCDVFGVQNIPKKFKKSWATKL